MKRILITGANSYIGTSFENWMSQYDGYEIDTIDTMDGKWKTADFSKYDVVLNVAGLAHLKLTEDMKDLYYRINTDLAVEIADYAKKHNIGQYIFMSSASVYGRDNTYIDMNTKPSPDNFYGDSKLQADIRLHKLQSEDFNVVSVRPPMVYGKGSKGNYPRLAKLAQKTPVFPSLKNQRSMIYIDNLCECVKLIIDTNSKGFFYPQNKEYVNTAQMVIEIANAHGKKVILTGLFNPVLKMLSKRITTINKLFGSLVYSKEMSDCFEWKYCVADFKKSIARTEEK